MIFWSKLPLIHYLVYMSFEFYLFLDDGGGCPQHHDCFVASQHSRTGPILNVQFPIALFILKLNKWIVYYSARSGCGEWRVSSGESAWRRQPNAEFPSSSSSFSATCSVFMFFTIVCGTAPYAYDADAHLAFLWIVGYRRTGQAARQLARVTNSGVFRIEKNLRLVLERWFFSPRHTF